MKRNAKVLVSGARGFLGYHLCEYLIKRGIDIVGYDNHKNRPTLDVTNLSQLLLIQDKVETIIHLAAKTSIDNSFLDPHGTYYTNLLGTLNLLEFARQRKVNKFINISTYVYGRPHYLPIDEKHPLDPHSPYNKSKVLAEQLCKFYSRDFEINIVTLRPFHIYGWSPRVNSLIYNILEQMKKNRKVKLIGESTKRDFLFIDDFLSLIVCVLKEFPNGYHVFNVGYGKSYTLTEVSHMLAKLLNKEISIDYDSQLTPGDITDIVADISKISNRFNWKPSISLEQGLEHIVKYYLLGESP